MHTRLVFRLGSLCALFVFCGFIFQPGTPTIWMMGDSTMAIKAENKQPETGWGEAFARKVQAGIRVDNRAKNGRSTKSFIDEGLWDAVQKGLKSGDYVLIQFGHNDEKLDKPHVGTTVAQYKANLASFVQTVLDKKATPILLTPISRRAFHEGKLVHTHQGYPAAVKAVADSMHIALIDLSELSFALLQEAGEARSKDLFLHLPTGSKNYPAGVRDDTHLNVAGAEAIATLVVNDIRRQQLFLVDVLKK